jgi:hypothetical protein
VEDWESIGVNFLTALSRGKEIGLNNGECSSGLHDSMLCQRFWRNLAAETLCGYRIGSPAIARLCISYDFASSSKLSRGIPGKPSGEH